MAQQRTQNEQVAFIERRLINLWGVGNWAYEHEDLPPTAMEGTGILNNGQYRFPPGPYIATQIVTLPGNPGLQTGQWAEQALVDPHFDPSAQG